MGDVDASFIPQLKPPAKIFDCKSIITQAEKNATTKICKGEKAFFCQKDILCIHESWELPTITETQLFLFATTTKTGEVSMDKLQFIKQVLPNDGWVNVREIDTQGKAQNKYFTLGSLATYTPPTDKNVYYGVFTRTEKKGTAAYCNKALSIWADYDDMTHAAVKEKIRQQGIPEPSIYVESGHGIHAYWLLDEPATTKALPIVKGIVKATGGDMRAAEQARVMRMPGTINLNGEAPVQCKVIEYNGHRYPLRQLEQFKLEIEQSSTGVIPELDNSERHCIRKIAEGVREGHRNFALGRITKYLQVKGPTKEKAKEIVTRWNTRNNPPEKLDKLHQDFAAYWRGDYKLLGCAIKNIELQSILGDYCNRAECRLHMTIGKLKLDNTVKYNNRLFNYIQNISGNDLIVYGVLMRHPQGLTTGQLIQKLTCRATKQCCMAKTTRIECLNRLEVLGLMESIEGNRRAGKENLYKAIPQGTYGMGYTIATNGAINGAIDGRVSPVEFKLYILLLKYAFQKGDCYPSIDTLAKDLRVDRSRISRYLTKLEMNDYISKNHTYPNNHEKLVMTLLV